MPWNFSIGYVVNIRLLADFIHDVFYLSIQYYESIIILYIDTDLFKRKVKQKPKQTKYIQNTVTRFYTKQKTSNNKYYIRY